MHQAIAREWFHLGRGIFLSPHPTRDSALAAIEPVDAWEVAPRFHLTRRIRTNQYSITTNGAKTGTNSHGDPRIQAGITRCWPRKNEPDAINKATHIRHRCRDNRDVPDSRPLTSSRTSPIAANVPMMMNT